MAANGSPVVIGVGASAGGVEALLELAGVLDADLPAAVLVVLHQPADAPTVLPGLMDKRCALPVRHARDGDDLVAGTVLLAPPDHHLLIVRGRLEVTRGPRENGHRPAIDPLFRSIAVEAGPAGIGCVLSGLLDDGAAGLLALVRHGGTAMVQDPDESLYASMPQAALEQVPGAIVRSVAELGAAFSDLATRPVIGGRRPDPRLVREVAASRAGANVDDEDRPDGPAAGLVCPDCSGPLFDLSEGNMLRYRCRVGHAWSEQSLSSVQDDGIERALFTALQALEDKADLQHRIARTATERGSTRTADRAREAAHHALASAGLVRDLLAEREAGDSA
ncbi:chemotaxis protein CheB [Actinomycetospora straminea]|uniref:protein-glutamate methylesterase n=1 Tax=Actinomycetospora straminea TaxID=663607 RepID=A0ABP9E928_9PSEU|nr:chemotaxis protein CheB [Actinomycetospora straminea]MDD7931950.1 chemotaxis protein CheB [Actinomycetospora straminea]